MASRSIDPKRFALLLLLGLGSCAPSHAPPPSPAPPPVPARVPVSPPAGDWRDWPLTPGSWRYLPGAPVSTARYGDDQNPQFVVRCDAASRRVTLMRAGSSTDLVIITSARTARFPAGHIDEGGVAMTGVILSASDGFLDAMAFSRGRIGVTSEGLSNLAVPAWAEPARAIEDCRK